MAVEEIPRSFLYTCDHCGAQHKQEHANGHYTESCPPKWSKIKIYRFYYEGDACVGPTAGSGERLFCIGCTKDLKIEIAGKALK